MSDAAAIVLILAVIYLVDCLHFLHRNAVAWTAWLTPECRARLASTAVGSRSAGVFLSPLLPPLGSTYVTQPLPVSFSPLGVCSFISPVLTPAGRPPQIGRVFRYEEIERLSADVRDVFVNGERFVQCRSERVARHVADVIRRLVKASPADRESLLRILAAESFDATAARAAVAACRASTRALRILCNLEWFWLFVVFPGVLLAAGLSFLFLLLAVGLLILHTAIMTIYWRRHRAMFPEATSNRVEGMLKMALCPPASVRAVDLISLDLLDLHHPLSAAAALAAPAELKRLAILLLREARHPLPPPADPPDLAAIADWHRAATLSAAEALMSAQGVDLSDIDRPPHPRDPAERTFCPRCHTTYTLDTGTCPDCSGIPLALLPSSGGEGVQA